MKKSKTGGVLILDFGSQVLTGERGQILGDYEAKEEALTISYAHDLSALIEPLDLSLGISWKKLRKGL